MNQGFKPFFASLWRPFQHSVLVALNNFKSKVQVWNKEVFGHISPRKKELIARIAGIQRIPNPRPGLRVMETNLIQSLNEVLDQEELLWKQKSRLQWTMEGDRNTKFFHVSTLVRRHRNRVDALKINNHWCTDPDQLRDHVSGFYNSLHCDGVDPTLSDSLPDPLVKLSDHMIAVLESPVSCAEVKLVLDSMGGLKPSGPDGVPTCFYQHHWDIVGPSLCAFVQNVFKSGHFPEEELNSSYISLFRKGRSTTDNILLL